MLTLDHLANPALLTLAAKKAYRHLDRHSWFFDRADATKFCGRMAFNVRRLSEALRAATYQPAPKLLFPAPKRVEIRSDESKRYIVRPLCTYPFRDQVVETAFVCLFADSFEDALGDVRRPAYPKLLAYGTYLPNFRMTFYARYVDDLRFVGCYPIGVGAPHRKATAHPVHVVVDRKLKSFGLRLSTNKSRLIAQNAGGTLLTTGQVAERMQNLKERLYMPLPPEDLDEAAKDLRLLFHAELPIPASGKGLNAPHFDNPGVRADSRRRFAAGKWIQVFKEMERLSTGWKETNREFASELVRSWLEKPEQVLLLHYALQIGLAAQETSEIVSRMRKLESNDEAYGYYAYVAAYFLDQASRRADNLVMQGNLAHWQKARKTCRHQLL